MGEYNTLQNCIKLMRDAKYQCTIQQPTEASFIMSDAIGMLSEIDLAHRKWFKLCFNFKGVKTLKVIDAVNDIEFNDKLNTLCSELKGADLVLIDMM